MDYNPADEFYNDPRYQEIVDLFNFVIDTVEELDDLEDKQSVIDALNRIEEI